MSFLFTRILFRRAGVRAALCLALIWLLLLCNVSAQQSNVIGPVGRVPHVEQPAKHNPSLNYEAMPANVKSKIDANKIAGLDPAYGLAKVFVVEMPACTNALVAEQMLAFLNNAQGFFRIEFISAGLVNVVVEPAFSSGTLKETLLAHEVAFGIVNINYIVSE